MRDAVARYLTPNEEADGQARILVRGAVMRRSGIQYIDSADRDFCPDVKRVDPMAIPSFD